VESSKVEGGFAIAEEVGEGDLEGDHEGLRSFSVFVLAYRTFWVRIF
jgi:hypothetical protein